MKSKQFKTIVSIGIIVSILFSVAFYFNEFSEKTAFEALKIKREDFLDEKWRDNELNIVNERDLAKIVDRISKHSVKRIYNDEFSNYFTKQKVMHLYGDNIYIQIGETFVFVNHFGERGKYFKILE